MTRVVVISDTHSLHWELKHHIPDGDIFLHAGDMTNVGSLEDIKDFCNFCDTITTKNMVVCGGNHDFCYENYNRFEAINLLKKHNIHYLENNSIEIEGLLIYGSGWTPKFFNWALMYERNSERATNLWNNIPHNTDVLITHGPPHGILDLTYYGKEHAGCEILYKKVKELEVPVHIFGHIHETYGTLKKGKTHYINASICDLKYRPINKPVVFDIDPKTKKVTLIDL